MTATAKRVYDHPYARSVEPTTSVPLTAEDGWSGRVGPARVCIRESRVLGSAKVNRGVWVEGHTGHGASMLTVAEARALAAALLLAADHIEAHTKEQPR